MESRSVVFTGPLLRDHRTRQPGRCHGSRRANVPQHFGPGPPDSRALASRLPRRRSHAYCDSRSHRPGLLKSPRVGRGAGLLAIAIAGCGHVQPHLTLPALEIGEPAFAATITGYTEAAIVAGNRIDVLLNGDEIFPAKLERDPGREEDHQLRPVRLRGRSARRRRRRARWPSAAGPASRSTCWSTPSARWRCPPSSTRLMTEAGCRVETFRPLRPFTLDRANYRNHRRILVADGRIGITGGSGTSGKWSGNGTHGRPMARHRRAGRGPGRHAAPGRVRRELARGDRRRAGRRRLLPPAQEARGRQQRAGRAQLPRGRQRRDVHDVPARRGVGAAVDPHHQPVLRARRQDDRDPPAGGAAGRARRPASCPGRSITISSARRAAASSGRLLRAGIEVYEYRAALLHSKTMVIDGVWSTVGSTNLDRRSFALNDELNLVVYDRAVAAAARRDLRAGPRAVPPRDVRGLAPPRVREPPARAARRPDQGSALARRARSPPR